MPDGSVAILLLKHALDLLKQLPIIADHLDPILLLTVPYSIPKEDHEHPGQPPGPPNPLHLPNHPLIHNHQISLPGRVRS